MAQLGAIGARLPQAAASVAEIVVGVGVAENAVVQSVAHARGRLFMEAICYDGDAALTALAGTIGEGTEVRMLSSPVMKQHDFSKVPDLQIALDHQRLHLVRYDDLVQARGDAAARGIIRWQHSKLASVETPEGEIRAWFSNVAPNAGSQGNSDVAVRLTGQTAQATHRVLLSTVTESIDAFDIAVASRAIDEAADAGLLFNDSLTGRHLLTDATDAMITGASERLLLIAKLVDDPEVARGLVAASQRGVRTGVVTSRLGREAAAILEVGKVRVALAPQHATYDRMNLLVADGTGLLSTGYPSRKLLRPDARGAVTGRDSALVLHGDDLGRLELALDGTTQGRIGRRFVAPAPETGARRGWLGLLTGRQQPAAPEGAAQAVWGTSFLPLGDPRAIRAIFD